MAKLPSWATRTIVGVVIVALLAGVAFFVFSGSSTRKISANFSEAIGVYPGTPVKVLGVDVGTVTKVHPEGGSVRVDMEYDSKYKLPKGVGALLVANSLVSDRFIQLTPAYSGTGEVEANNARIPITHTESPAELDDIYKALSDLSVALGPSGANKDGALQDLLHVAAINLQGNGQTLGQSITNLSNAAKTLADGRGDLFATVQNLQQFTKTLQSSDAQVRHFEDQLSSVSADLANERTDFTSALHDLDLALGAVANFVNSNATKFHTSIVGLEKITGILIKEKASLNETLAVAPVALANIVHAYQPNIGIIASRGNLASFTDPRQICGLLDESGLFSAVPIPALQALLGGLFSSLVSTCKTVLKSTGQTNSASQTQLTTPELKAVAQTIVGDPNDISGLITGGH